MQLYTPTLELIPVVVYLGSKVKKLICRINAEKKFLLKKFLKEELVNVDWKHYKVKLKGLVLANY